MSSVKESTSTKLFNCGYRLSITLPYLIIGLVIMFAYYMGISQTTDVSETLKLHQFHIILSGAILGFVWLLCGIFGKKKWNSEELAQKEFQKEREKLVAENTLQKAKLEEQTKLIAELDSGRAVKKGLEKALEKEKHSLDAANARVASLRAQVTEFEAQQKRDADTILFLQDLLKKRPPTASPHPSTRDCFTPIV